MKNPWILPTAIAAAGHLLTLDALAAPPTGDMAVPVRTEFVRVQGEQTSEAVQDRVSRLWQHRAILRHALQQPNGASLAAPPQPQVRALRPPEPMNEPMIATAPPPEEPAGQAPGQVTCEDAAGIVAEFGFSDIGVSDCSGDLYRFSAMRDGTAYAIGISAATGEIAEVSRR